MPTIVRLPEVLTGMTEATVSTWLAAPGDEIKAGQPLAEVETEKAVVECAAEESGTLAGFLVDPGQPIQAGTPIAVLAGPGESAEEALSAAGGTAAAGTSVVAEPAPVPVAAPAEAGPTPGASRAFASPIVRRLARERGLDLSQIQGSGPGDRIVRRDLDRLEPVGRAQAPAEVPTAPKIPPAPAPAADVLPLAAPRSAGPAGNAGESTFTDIPHTRMRRAIARRLTESKSTVPHFYLTADCHVDDLIELRREVNELAKARVTLNDFVVKAVASAFADVPEANAIWTPDAIRRFSSVSVGIAVAVDGGLVTPVLHDAGRRSLTDISRAIADLAERARQGRLRQPEIEGGSFAVSNLGMYGTERFAAIINPPHAGILAVGAAAKRPVAAENGTLGVATMMTVTLSGDHRVLDGALGAQWLAAFKRRVEQPLSILT
jgi:pyruvate dehydrogenase E2 component (dihydrolipoamide acetyltransferase)